MLIAARLEHACSNIRPTAGSVPRIPAAAKDTLIANSVPEAIALGIHDDNQGVVWAETLGLRQT